MDEVCVGKVKRSEGDDDDDDGDGDGWLSSSSQSGLLTVVESLLGLGLAWRVRQVLFITMPHSSSSSSSLRKTGESH